MLIVLASLFSLMLAKGMSAPQHSPYLGVWQGTRTGKSSLLDLLWRVESVRLSTFKQPSNFSLLLTSSWSDEGLMIIKVLTGSVSSGDTWNWWLSCTKVASVMCTCLKHPAQYRYTILPICLPWQSSLLHIVSSGYIITPYVILPFLKTNNTTQNIACVHSNPHISLNTCFFPQSSAKPSYQKEDRSMIILLDDLYHSQPHIDCIDGMVWSGDGQPWHTVVTVTKDLDPHALVCLRIYCKLSWIFEKQANHFI